MAVIEIKNVNLGGIAKSAYQGLANSVAEMVGLDIHGEPGVIKVNQKLTKESGTTVDDFVKKILPCSDGNTYLFGSTSGKIWKRTSAGVYSLEATASPAAGSAGIKDAIEDQGYIYYFMQSRIGRVAVGSPTSWAGRNDSWATFANTDADFHPVRQVNMVNYIGDGKYVAQIEDGVFTDNAFDIKSPLRVKSLGIYDTELLIGDYINDNINATEIFRWNTWSVSHTNSDPVPEKGINAFIKTDNYILVSVGEKGNLYQYNGQQLVSPRCIPGLWGVGQKATVHPNATANFQGLPLFGFSNVANNPCYQALWSYGSYDGDYSPVLNVEYVISLDRMSSIEIGDITVIDDYLLVSWKYGSTYGIDKLDASNKYASAYLETRVIQPDRGNLNKIGKIKVFYRSLPTGTDIEIWKSVNGAIYEKMTTKKDTKRLYIETAVDILDVSTLQIKVLPKVSGNDAPEMEGIEINV